MAESEVIGTIPPTAERVEKPKPEPKADHKAEPSAPKVAAALDSASDRPTRALPTDRIGFAKQLQLLRAYAALAAQTGRAVSNPEVAQVVGLNRSTSLLAHAFFFDAGLLEKSGTGSLPVAEVTAFHKAYSWNAETAGYKLAPRLRRQWFAERLLPRLATLGPMSEADAVRELAEACGAGRKYDSQLRLLLDFLSTAGLIRREADRVEEGPTATEGEPMPRAEAVGASADRASDTDAPAPREATRAPTVATSFSQVPEGVLRFHVEVNVDLRDFANWRPDRIAAFWAGIAQVLAAKAAVEGEAGR